MARGEYAVPRDTTYWFDAYVLRDDESLVIRIKRVEEKDEGSIRDGVVILPEEERWAIKVIESVVLLNIQ